jgi:hypothetical protein
MVVFIFFIWAQMASNKDFIQYKFIYCTISNNFGKDRVNIRDYLEILNSRIWELTNYFLELYTD